MGASGRRTAAIERWAAGAGVLAFLAIAIGSVWGAVGYVGTTGEPYSPLNHWISELGQVSVAAHAAFFNLMLVLGGGLFVAFVAYLIFWFFARNLVDGQGVVIEIGGHVLVILLSLAAGFSSFRASRLRR